MAGHSGRGEKEREKTTMTMCACVCASVHRRAFVVVTFEGVNACEGGLLARLRALLARSLPVRSLPLSPSSWSPYSTLTGTGLFWFTECRARRACAETVKCARCATLAGERRGGRAVCAWIAAYARTHARRG